MALAMYASAESMATHFACCYRVSMVRSSRKIKPYHNVVAFLIDVFCGKPREKECFASSDIPKRRLVFMFCKDMHGIVVPEISQR